MQAADQTGLICWFKIVKVPAVATAYLAGLAAQKRWHACVQFQTKGTVCLLPADECTVLNVNACNALKITIELAKHLAIQKKRLCQKFSSKLFTVCKTGSLTR